jgi:hypothetical protein
VILVKPFGGPPDTVPASPTPYAYTGLPTAYEPIGKPWLPVLKSCTGSLNEPDWFRHLATPAITSRLHCDLTETVKTQYATVAQLSFLYFDSTAERDTYSRKIAAAGATPITPRAGSDYSNAMSLMKEPRAHPATGGGLDIEPAECLVYWTSRTRPLGAFLESISANGCANGLPEGFWQDQAYGGA